MGRKEVQRAAVGGRILGPVEAARILGVSLSSVQRWVDAGAIPSHQTLGGHHRIQEQDLYRFARREGIPVASGASGGTVLVVDDEEDIREALVARIRGLRPDLEVLDAADGFSAGVLVSDRRPGLVLLDIRLPGVPGVEVCRRIKSDPATAGIHVVGVTGTAKRTEIESLREAGAEDVLMKPIDKATLREILERCIPVREVPAR